MPEAAFLLQSADSPCAHVVVVGLDAGAVDLATRNYVRVDPREGTNRSDRYRQRAVIGWAADGFAWSRLRR